MESKFKVGQIWFSEYNMAKLEITKVEDDGDLEWAQYEVVEGSISGINIFVTNSPFANSLTPSMITPKTL